MLEFFVRTYKPGILVFLQQISMCIYDVILRMIITYTELYSFFVTLKNLQVCA